MDKNNLTAGIIIVVIIFLGLGWWFWSTFPSKTAVESATNVSAAIDVNILKSNTVQTVQRRDKNGDIPVTVNSGEIGREDPFSNY